MHDEELGSGRSPDGEDGEAHDGTKQRPQDGRRVNPNYMVSSSAHAARASAIPTIIHGLGGGTKY